MRKAAASLIPFDMKSFVSVDNCSEDWGRFMSWWNCNQDVRASFLIRELMFAASDAEIRRHAELSGISMKERKSHDPEVRRAWSKNFGHWYYFGSEITAGTQSTIKKSTSVYHSCPSIQHYEFETEQDEPCRLDLSSSRCFPHKVLQAPADSTVTAEKEVDLSEDKQAGVCCTEAEDQLVVIDMNIKSFHATVKAKTSPKPPLVLPRNCTVRDRVCVQSTEASVNLGKTAYANTHAHISKMQGSTVDGIVGARIQTQRGRLLERITKKVQEARKKAEEISGISRELRGIELFRSKVRLVILLQKLAPSQRHSGGSDFQYSPAPLTENLFDIFEFDHAMYDFDALKTKQPKVEVKVPRYDCIQVKEMRQRSILKVLKTFFLDWKTKQLFACNKMKANAISAELAYITSLVKRTFQKFRVNIEGYRKERLAEEQRKAKEATESVTCESPTEIEMIQNKFDIKQTSSFEVRQMSFEDELATKFRENCRCHMRFRIDPSFLPNPAPSRSALANNIQAEHKEFLANGIQLDESIKFFDNQTLRRLKRDKLKAARCNEINIFDVPPDVLVKSFSVEEAGNYDEKQTQYRMKEKVNHLFEISG